MMKYVLLVDDKKEEQIFFRNSLLKMHRDINLLIASNGIEGIRIYRKITPDIVILKLYLPDMTGMECLVRMKTIVKSPDIPVYVYNSVIDDSLDQKARLSGAAGCLSANHLEEGLRSCMAGLFPVSRHNS